jgi:hypothetical protein
MPDTPPAVPTPPPDATDTLTAVLAQLAAGDDVEIARWAARLKRGEAAQDDRQWTATEEKVPPRAAR